VKETFGVSYLETDLSVEDENEDESVEINYDIASYSSDFTPLSRVALRRVRRHAYPGAVRGCLVLVVGSDVLGYGAFGPIIVLQNRTARLTQPCMSCFQWKCQERL